MTNVHCMFVRVGALVGALFSLAGCGDPIAPTTGRVIREAFASTAADQTFDILVRLPPEYEQDATRRYPVVYQLDATFLDEFDRSAGTISRLAAAGTIRESIVVGIGHRFNRNPDRNRFVDFVPADPNVATSRGRAAEFYRFVHDELAPRVESMYRVDPAAGRVLVGHSLGGLFALYAFCQREPDGAPFFARVLAADPTYGTNDGVAFHYIAQLAAATRSRPGRLFLTASLYTGGAQRFPHEEMTRRVSAAFVDLEFRSTYEQTDHGGLIQRSLDQGLPFVLGGAQ